MIVFVQEDTFPASIRDEYGSELYRN